MIDVVFLRVLRDDVFAEVVRDLALVWSVTDLPP